MYTAEINQSTSIKSQSQHLKPNHMYNVMSNVKVYDYWSSLMTPAPLNKTVSTIQWQNVRSRLSGTRFVALVSA